LHSTFSQQTILTQKLVVNFTNNYKEMASTIWLQLKPNAKKNCEFVTF